jgi:hypothetical protein
MQVSLDATGTRRPVRILGVNGAGLEGSNSLMTAGRTLPWLQDTTEQQVWTSWHVTYRDVVVLDARNRAVAVFNLTVHDLHRAAARDSLLQILRAAAE